MKKCPTHFVFGGRGGENGPHTLYMEVEDEKNVPKKLEDEKMSHILCIWRWRMKKCPTYFLFRGGG
jgi:hypothetical protein